MAKQKYLFFGIGFLIIALILMWFYEPKPPLVGITQNTATKTPYLYEAIGNGNLAVQEITLTKDFLNGLEIRFATMGKVNTSTNTILVLDSNYNLLHQEKFSSEIIEDAKYHAFQFKESMKVGKGIKIYICLFSKDGDSANSIHMLFNNDLKIGNLYASLIINDDVIRSIPNKARLYPGSLILRTYESDVSFSNPIKWLWYALVILLTLVIIFTKKIQPFLGRLNIRPEMIFAPIALIFGSLIVFLNPPLQVPDEGSHIYRTFELSELQFANTAKTIPASVFKLDSIANRLRFNPDAKTSKKEILSLETIKLEPSVRKESMGPDYIVPYLPQTIGVVIGKMFTSSPWMLMYFGRFFNLIFAILLVFMAIRIAPFSKWIFFLLALMPKTIYLMASLSYDAFIISASFLLIALFLYYAFKAEKIYWKDLLLLLFLWLLLGLCKPPYFMIGFLFLIIPFRKIKALSKYLLIVPAILVSLALAFGIWKIGGELFTPKQTLKTEQPSATGPATASNDSLNAAAAQTPGPPMINPKEQVQYIRNNLPTFLKLIVATNFDHMRASMLNNFVGTMGWLDTFLPDTLVNLYLLVLLIAALFIAEESIRFDWKRKLFLFLIFIGCILAIETAMYIYSSYVGQERLFGVQGRYFIPLAPLFLLLFYNSVISTKLNYLFSVRRKAYLAAKPLQKPKILAEIKGDQIFMKYLQASIILFAVVTMVRTIAAILLRYYQW